MCGTEIYQATTVTFMVKCILNHTSQRCKAHCVRRAGVWAGGRRSGDEAEAGDELPDINPSDVLGGSRVGWGGGRHSERV
jgi:hypothetical protein